jgi:hypothetical protein
MKKNIDSLYGKDIKNFSTNTISSHRISTAEVRNEKSHYLYSFSPEVGEGVFSAASKKMIADELVPKGGGLVLQKALALSFGGSNEVNVQTVIGLSVPKRTPKEVVKRLFSLLRMDGLKIQISDERYPKDDSLESIVDQFRSELPLRDSDFSHLNRWDGDDGLDGEGI